MTTLVEKVAKKIGAPRFESLRELARHALRRRKALLEELHILEVTLSILAKEAEIHIDLDKNVVVER